MIFSLNKYLGFAILQSFFIIALLLFLNIQGFGQNTGMATDSPSVSSRLFYYHSAMPEKKSHPFQRIDYTRPNNQLMSWPNYPLTATEMERRHRIAAQENKLSNVIAKDIITSILSKKKKVAVIPKF